MPIGHDSSATSRALGAIPLPTRQLTSKGSAVGKNGQIATIPIASRGELSFQHRGGAVGPGFVGIPYSAASNVELLPGTATAAAATAAAAAIRNHAAAQAVISAFAAHTARSSQASHAASLFRENQQAFSVATGVATAWSAAADLRAKQPMLPGNYHHNRGTGHQRPGEASAANTRSYSTPSRCTSGNNSSTGTTGGSGRGHHAGAAYCLIPQPAYHHDHEHRPYQSPLQNCNRTSTSNSTSGMGAMGPRLLTEGTGGKMQTKQRMQATSKWRRQPERGGSSRLPDANDSSNVKQHEQQPWQQHQQCGLVDGARTSGGGDLGDCQKQGGSCLSAEVRLERSRVQNRQSSRKARIRRKGEEESLKEEIQSVQEFRLMIEEAPDMMSIHGLDHRAPFRYASGAFQRVAGINPGGVLGRELTDLIVEEDHAVVQQAILKVVFSQAASNVVSYRMLTPKGGTLRVEASIRTGDQCIVCVARAVAQEQSQLLRPLSPSTPEKKKTKLCDGDDGTPACSTNGTCSGDNGGGRDAGSSGSSSSGSNTATSTSRFCNDDDDDSNSTDGNKDSNVECKNTDIDNVKAEDNGDNSNNDNGDNSNNDNDAKK